MIRQLRAWGNSIGVRIPNKIFQKTRFNEDADVDIQIIDDETLQLTLVDDADDGGRD